MSSLAITPRRARPISLTALIDVVFILLMFFMLTSSFSQWLTLPLASQSAVTTNSRSDELPQLLVLHHDGSVTLAQDKPARFDALEQAIGQIDHSSKLVVLPEADIQVQRIVEVMTTLATLELPAVTLGQALSGTDAATAVAPPARSQSALFPE
ncbi:ExbD/TolR family protein [Candidatus Thalassolituus haligoni]|uniref:ExbD/TolR family protein n=1 Tax=Candidatus Thalassolituus haligoni TaxID=3100113 RepID=UPI003515FB50